MADWLRSVGSSESKPQALHFFFEGPSACCAKYQVICRITAVAISIVLSRGSTEELI